MKKTEKRDRLLSIVARKRSQLQDLMLSGADGLRHNHRMARLRGVITKTQQALSRVNAGESALRASDHAILRYLERVKGVDVEAAKAEMLADKMEEQALEFHSGEFPSADGSHYLNVKDFVVVTCYDKLRTPKMRKSKPTEGKNRKGR